MTAFLPRPARLPLTLAAAGALLAGTAPHALALESGTPVEAGDAEADRVVSLQITNDGDPDGDCTGTAVAPRWVVTARHCVEGFDKPSGSVRLGQGEDSRRVDIDHWELAPEGDIAAVHVTEDLGLKDYPGIAEEAPKETQGRFYGWSPDGTAGTERPVAAAAEAKGPSPLALFEAKEGLDVKVGDGASLQPGDSGGPLFVDGKVAAVLSAGLSADPEGGDTPEDGAAAMAPLAPQREWLEKTIAADPEPAAASGVLDGVKEVRGPVLVGVAIAAVAVIGGAVFAVARKRGALASDEAGKDATGDSAS